MLTTLNVTYQFMVVLMTTAFNYNELATTDNGTCIPVIEGCMNP